VPLPNCGVSDLRATSEVVQIKKPLLIVLVAPFVRALLEFSPSRSTFFFEQVLDREEFFGPLEQGGSRGPLRELAVVVEPWRTWGRPLFIDPPWGKGPRLPVRKCKPPLFLATPFLRTWKTHLASKPKNRCDFPQFSPPQFLNTELHLYRIH